MARYRFAEVAGEIECSELRQRFVNASRTLHRMQPERLLQYVRRKPLWFRS